VARSALCTQTLRVDGTQGPHSVYERWILNAVCAINFNYSMRVLSKIQSSLSELTFMHAGLITARSIPLRLIFFYNECRAHKSQRGYNMLCAPSIICVWESEQYHSRQGVWRALSRAQDKTPELWMMRRWILERPRDTDFLINILY
jgi:hypothetical protein